MAYLLTFAGALTNLVLGAIVYRRNPSSPVHQTFSWLMTAMAFWMLAALLSQKVSDHQLALLLARLAFISASAIALFGLLFADVFPNGTRIVYMKSWWWIVWVIGLLMMLLSASPFVAQDVELFPWGANLVPGQLYLLFPVYFLGFIGSALQRVYVRWNASKGRARHQIAYFLTGLVLTALLASWTNLILPLVSGSNPYAQYGPLASIFLTGFTGYAILAYRLFDIRKLAGKTVVHLGLLLFIWSGYVVVVSFLPELLAGKRSEEGGLVVRATSILVGLIVTLGFAPLKEWLERSTGRLLFSRQQRGRGASH